MGGPGLKWYKGSFVCAVAEGKRKRKRNEMK